MAQTLNYLHCLDNCVLGMASRTSRMVASPENFHLEPIKPPSTHNDTVIARVSNHDPLHLGGFSYVSFDAAETTGMLVRVEEQSERTFEPSRLPRVQAYVREHRNGCLTVCTATAVQPPVYNLASDRIPA